MAPREGLGKYVHVIVVLRAAHLGTEVKKSHVPLDPSARTFPIPACYVVSTGHVKRDTCKCWNNNSLFK